MFSGATENWRSLVRANAGGIPVEFLMAWIDYESGGNPAALGSQYEVGLFQINMADGAVFGGSVDTLHRNFAAATSQKANRALTDDEKVLQVTTGVAQASRYADLSDQRLAAVGSSWTRGSSDLWCMCKLHHGLPALPSSFLPAFASANGRGPSSWDEFASYLTNISHDDATSIHAGAAAYWGQKGKPGFKRFTDNAYASGQYGGVEATTLSLGGRVPFDLAILLLLAGAGALFGG